MPDQPQAAQPFFFFLFLVLRTNGPASKQRQGIMDGCPQIAMHQTTKGFQKQREDKNKRMLVALSAKLCTVLRTENKTRKKMRMKKGTKKEGQTQDRIASRWSESSPTSTDVFFLGAATTEEEMKEAPARKSNLFDVGAPPATAGEGNSGWSAAR
jgi:hypothetical protein